MSRKMNARLMLIIIIFVTTIYTRDGVFYFECGGRVLEASDWMTWFVPEVGARVSKVQLQRKDEQTDFLLSCRHLSESLPIAELTFECTQGCIFSACPPNPAVALKIFGSVWNVYIYGVNSNHTGVYTLTVTFYSESTLVFRTDATASIAVSPDINATSMISSDINIQKALQDETSDILTEHMFTASKIKNTFLEGKEIEASGKICLGTPSGTAEVYLIRLLRHNNMLLLQNCDVSFESISKARYTSLSFSCIPTVEDVGIIISVFNVFDSSYKLDEARNHIKYYLIQKITPWLIKTQNETIILANQYGFARRVIWFKTVWHAVVLVGNAIRMFCYIPSKKHSEVVCQQNRALDSNANLKQQLPEGFQILRGGQASYFTLEKDEASENDSGVYSCSTTVCDGQCVTEPSCSNRRLNVVPLPPKISIHIRHIRGSTNRTEFKDYFTQYLDNRKLEPYLSNGESAVIVCGLVIPINTNVKINFTYTHIDPKTEARTPLPAILDHSWEVETGNESISWFHFYRIGGHNTSSYSGKLEAVCSLNIPDTHQKVPSWMLDPNDVNENEQLSQISSVRKIIYNLQRISGELHFRSGLPNLEVHPVPLGTQITCRGGLGYPFPQYAWSRVNLDKSNSDGLFEKYASALPLDPNGFDNVPQIMLNGAQELPSNTFNGETLTLPTDESFRGRSFLFKCQGSNVIKEIEYKISRVLHVTISICEHHLTKLDVSIVFSPQMVAGSMLRDVNRKTTSSDFFGKRYLPLIRQIILGMSNGPQLNRFNTIPSTVLTNLSNNKIYHKSIPFHHNLTRFELVKEFISSTISPSPKYKSDENACPLKHPVQIYEALTEVLKFAKLRQDSRRHIVIIPGDRWDNISSENEMKNVLRELQQNNAMIFVLFFATSVGGSWKSIYEMDGANTFNMMPNWQHHFSDCSRVIETDPSTFLNSLQLFNAICQQAQRADIVEGYRYGVLFRILPTKMYLESVTATYYCQFPLNPYYRETFQLHFCIANTKEIENFNRRTSYEEVLAACKLKILKTTQWTNKTDTCLSTDFRITLEPIHNVKSLICFKKNPTHFSFMKMPIFVKTMELSYPTLVITHWPEKAGDSAEVRCVMDAVFPSVQVDLIYQAMGKNGFVVAARCKSKFFKGDVGKQSSVRLYWFKVPQAAHNASLHCLVSRPGITHTTLPYLPKPTDQLRFSPGVRRLLITSCPQPPVIFKVTTDPLTTETIIPRLGSRMKFVCDAVTGAENAPIQMAYVDDEVNFVICSMAGQQADDYVNEFMEIKVPCRFAKWQNGGCFQNKGQQTSEHPKKIFTECFVIRQPGSLSAQRKINFVVPIVEFKHFGGFVFCETTPRSRIETIVADENRLISDKLINYFKIPPQVFSLNVNKAPWECNVVAYPKPEISYFNVINTHPSEIFNKLRAAANKSHVKEHSQMKMQTQAPNFFPKRYLIDWKDRFSPYFVRLFRVAITIEDIGEDALLTLKCFLTNGVSEDKKDASHRIIHVIIKDGKKIPSWLPKAKLIPDVGLINVGDEWGVKCPIMREIVQKNIHLMLMVNFKIKLISIYLPVLKVKLNLQKTGEMRSLRINSIVPMGIWRHRNLDNFNVSLTDLNKDPIVEIEIRNATLSDSGLYSCRFYAFDIYNDAMLFKELVVKRQLEKPILGYKLNNSNVWIYSNTKIPMLPEHTPVTTRCYLWKPNYSHSTTVTQNKLIMALFASLTGPFHEIPYEFMKVRQFMIEAHMLAYLADYSFETAIDKHARQYFGCFADLVNKNDKDLGTKIGPFLICSPLTKLIISPDTFKMYILSDELNCATDKVGFPKPSITWMYKTGPMPPMKTPPDDESWKSIVNSSKLSLSRLPDSGFYIYTCIAVSNCMGREEKITKEFKFTVSSDRTTSRKTTKISPMIVLVSKLINVECPNIISHANVQHVILISLTWFRVLRKVNQTEPHKDKTAEVIMKHNFIDQTIERPTPNFANATRLINYKTSNGHFALDIKPTIEQDFGYYGCVLDVSEHGSPGSWQMGQVTSAPACIVKQSDNPKLNVTSTFETDKCYHINNVVNIICSVDAYQVFCDNSDKPYGLAVIATNAKLTITYPIVDHESEIINLTAISRSVHPGSIPRLWLTLNTVSFKIGWKHNDVTVACETEPELKKTYHNAAGDDIEFNTTFDAMKSQLKRSTAIKICVDSPPRNIRIDPPPPDQTSIVEVTFELKVGSWLMCFADGNPTPKIELEIEPLKKESIQLAMEFAPKMLEKWKDETRSQPDWVSEEELGQTRIQIGATDKEDTSAALYVGICRATNNLKGKSVSKHRIFIFQVRVQTEIPTNQHFYKVSLATLILSLLTFIITSLMREFFILSRRSWPRKLVNTNGFVETEHVGTNAYRDYDDVDGVDDDDDDDDDEVIDVEDSSDTLKYNSMLTTSMLKRLRPRRSVALQSVLESTLFNPPVGIKPVLKN